MLIKPISSLEKVFLDSLMTDFPTTDRVSALRGERVSFQIAYTAGREKDPVDRLSYTVALSGSLAPLARIRSVENVPVTYPVFPDCNDDNYLRKTPGLYPDLLSPLSYVGEDAPYGKVIPVTGLLRALWIDFTIPENFPAGKAMLTVRFSHESKDACETTFTVDVIAAALPKQELFYTEWFHCDALAQFYRVPVWSDEHFRLIGNFARTARENGVNLLLTPVFTPPLDTAVGGERLTTQLVKVTKTGDSYAFAFDLLDRYLDVITAAGIEYYEISHLYTQGGACHAPKIVAEVNGKEERIFGWDTDSRSEEYTAFLRAFLKAFLAHMKTRGEDKKCFFHISDEPQLQHIENYRRCKEAIGDLLEGYVVMDALSNYEFYRDGLVKTPIPCSNHIKPFLEAKVPGLWTYYCCGQCVDVSNRLIAMPSWRNRVIGLQLFRYDIVGFLQWGYNFYNNCHSGNDVNPYIDLSGEYWVPAGDTFSVYPGLHGEALESLRLIVFYEGVNDMRALQLCASLCGKEKTIRALEKAYGRPISFDDCPHSADVILKVRETINRMIRLAVKK